MFDIVHGLSRADAVGVVGEGLSFSDPPPPKRRGLYYHIMTFYLRRTAEKTYVGKRTDACPIKVISCDITLGSPSITNSIDKCSLLS